MENLKEMTDKELGQKVADAIRNYIEGGSKGYSAEVMEILKEFIERLPKGMDRLNGPDISDFTAGYLKGLREGYKFATKETWSEITSNPEHADFLKYFEEHKKSRIKQDKIDKEEG
jgi:bifunctional pyridoxal-dependent enzyme with beta-cystathionase and maltose regulon repressor activities